MQALMNQNNKLLLVHDKRCSVSHWPPASEIGMLLITNFLGRGVVAARGRKLASRQHAVSERQMLIHAYHTVTMLFPMPSPCCGLERPLSERHIRGMAEERNGNDTVCVNQTRPHRLNQIGKTQSKSLSRTAWQGSGRGMGRGAARERHGNSMGTAWYVWVGLNTHILYTSFRKLKFRIW
jgi:hypothetical protein